VALFCGYLSVSTVSFADYVVGGSMTQNLSAKVFRDPASTDPSLDGFADPAQPILIFGKHFGPADTAGQSVVGFRPLAVDPGLPQIGPPSQPVALPRTNYRDDPATIEASIGSSTGLDLGVNGPAISPSGLPGRAEQSSTLSFDPANFIGTVTGGIGLDGATSLWYANTPIINTGSVWLGYGDLSLSYDGARAAGGDSGWFFTNHLLFDLPLYDIQNFQVTGITPATESTPGSLTITGDLYISPEFGGPTGFGMKSELLVGSFTLNAVTAVPEPASVAMAAIGVLGLVAVGLRRRRRTLA